MLLLKKIWLLTSIVDVGTFQYETIAKLKSHFEFSHTYRISSYKTRGYYFFTRPSTSGIIRTRVLIEGWYYYQNFIKLANPEMFIIKIARFFMASKKTNIRLSQ